MSDGTVSPKFGGKAYTNSCEFYSPVKKIVATYRERGLVSLTFESGNNMLLTIQGEGVGKNTDTVEVIENVESLVQFKCRMDKNVIQGIQFGVMTTQEIMNMQ